MDGKLFCRTARFLLTDGDGIRKEASHRSAISRSYYACFLVIRNSVFSHCDHRILKKRGWSREQEIGHKNLCDLLKKSSNEIIQRLGEDLDGLRGNRHDADYKMSRKISFGDANDAVENAENILMDFTQISPNDFKNNIESIIEA